MNDFIEECRREWKRLGVPDPLAEEMATDLSSDLSEAAAEGVSVERLLGRVASDPQAFAASWAAERGVVAEQPAGRDARRKPFFLLAFTVLAAITVVVSAALLATGEPKVSLVKSRIGPPPSSHIVASASAAAPIEWVLLLLAVIALAFAGWLWTGWSRSRARTAPA